MGVRHRIDGLEMSAITRFLKGLVRHRIDGLEIKEPFGSASSPVRHRIDGLENQVTKSLIENNRSPSHRWFRNLALM